MLLVIVFSLIAIFGTIRTVSFGIFTARDKNYPGAVMLFILSGLLVTCIISVLCRL